MDYRDRWRTDRFGRSLLPLRRVGVLIRHLPVESATTTQALDGKVPWTRAEHLLDEVRRAVLAGAGKRNPAAHPDRKQRPPKLRRLDPDWERRVTRARQRATRRAAMIKAGEIT